MRYTILLSLAFASSVNSQFPSYGQVDTQNVCQDQLATPANATGVQNNTYQLNNGLGLWNVAISTNSSATTIEDGRELTQNSPGAVANVWLDPFQNVSLNDGTNGYSACAFVFKALPRNTILRGQDDDTSCEQTLSKQCIEAITSRAAETAKWLVANPTRGPFSNLTPPILNYICQDIYDGIGRGGAEYSNPFPSECRPFFDDGSSFYPSADTFILTDNKTRPENCTFYQEFNHGGVLLVNGYNAPAGVRYPFNSTNGTAVASYDELVQQVWPILTVTFPPANISSQASVGNADGVMTCISAANVKDGSRVPPTLPAAKAVHFPGELSKGAIAGIVVGSLLGAAIIGGVIWWFWRKRSKQSKPMKLEDKPHGAELSSRKEAGESYQLDSKGAPVQLDGSQRGELSNGESRPELSAERPPQELPGSDPVFATTK